MKGVKMIGGVTYDRIDDAGLHITTKDGPTVVPCDTVVLCAGQVPENALVEQLKGAGSSFQVIGGADVAAELDAKRAIDQGARVAAEI